MGRYTPKWLQRDARTGSLAKYLLDIPIGMSFLYSKWNTATCSFLNGVYMAKPNRNGLKGSNNGR